MTTPMTPERRAEATTLANDIRDNCFPNFIEMRAGQYLDEYEAEAKRLEAEISALRKRLGDDRPKPRVYRFGAGI